MPLPKVPKPKAVDYSPVSQHYIPPPAGIDPVEYAAITNAAYNQSHGPSDARGYGPSKRYAAKSSNANIQNRLASVPDWDPHEGYYQPGLIEGTSEFTHLPYNPPAATPVSQWLRNPGKPIPERIPIDFDSPDYIPPVDHPFIPGMTPPGVTPVGTPPGRGEQEYGFWDNLGAGFGRGWDYAVSSKPWGFTRSVLWHRAPSEEILPLTPAARGGFAIGRIAGDALGYGSRSAIWRLHPEDVAGTNAQNFIKNAGGDRSAQILGMAGATAALSLGSGNINYFNTGQGLRPSGFGTTNPDAEDPRQTDNLPMEYFNRSVLGRTGRLLPWEQFRKERPEVDYETYENYKDYLRDSGILGLAKGTWDGIDGPEARIMGYRVTPLGALAAAGVIAGTTLGVKRYAGLKR